MLSKNNPAPVSSLALIPKRQCSPEDPPIPQPSACVTLFIGIHFYSDFNTVREQDQSRHEARRIYRWLFIIHRFYCN